MEKNFKVFYLNEELKNSVKLIEIGLGEYQKLDSVNDFYFLPFQLISSGLERLMKCHICLGCYEKRNDFPPINIFMKKLGHDLKKLTKHIIDNYFQINNIPVLQEDFEYINNDRKLDEIIDLLSGFGKFARYYNLDVITGNKKNDKDVVAEWKAFETNIVIENKNLLEKVGTIGYEREVNDAVKQYIIIKLERFVRALSRQFTLGNLGALAKQCSPNIFSFLDLNDTNLGKTDYREESTKHKEKNYKPHKRTILDKIKRKIKKDFKSKTIKKEDFTGEWPFLSNEIAIECRKKYWCIITINGYDYALNGLAKGRYKYEDVYEAGVAILGKSIAPFIEMALELGKEKI